MKKFIGIILIMFFLSFLVPAEGAESVNTSDSSSWNINRNVTALNRISCFKNKIYIAAGDYGTIRTSSDCINWKVVESIPTGSDILDIVCTDRQVVAVGENGLILSSADGYDWKVVEPVTTDKITKIIYGNNTFVAFTNNQGILTSNDGLNWKESTAGHVISDAIYNGELFIAYGNGGEISSSVDGLSWKTKILKDGTKFLKIIWNGKIFTAFGIEGTPVCTTALYAATSKDGYNWTVKTVNIGPVIEKYKDCLEYYSPNIIWNGKKFIVTALETYGAYPQYVSSFISSDGLSWERYSFEPEDSSGYASISTVLAGSRYISVCNQYDPPGNYDAQTIYVSNDGIKWNKVISRRMDSIGKASDIIYNKGTAIIVGMGGDIATSRDGLKWDISNNNHKLLCEKENKFIAVDSEITYTKKKFEAEKYTYKKYIYTSIDGLLWTKEKEIKDDIDLSNLVWSEREYISLNKNYIYTSNNLVTWKKEDISSLKKLGHINSFTADSNWYVLFGDKGTAISKDKKKWTIRTNSSHYTPKIIIGKNCLLEYNYGSKQISVSADGVKWKDVKFTDSKCSINQIVYSGNQFICIGSDCILYSKDGLNWNKAQTPDKFNGSIGKIVYSGSSYAATGQRALLYSEDGSVWTETYSIDNDSGLLDLGWTGSVYILAGYAGVVKSKDGASWQKENLVQSRYYISEVIGNDKIYIAYSGGNPVLYKVLK